MYFLVFVCVYFLFLAFGFWAFLAVLLSSVGFWAFLPGLLSSWLPNFPS